MVIAIAGGSASGKTSLAKRLAKKLGANLISLDSFFKDPSTFPLIYDPPNYDRLAAIDFNKAIKAIEQQPKNKDLVIEGFLVLANQKLRDLINVSFFIDSDPDVLISRRLAREPTTNPDYIIKNVGDQYQKLVLPTKRHADFTLDGSQPTRHLLTSTLSYLNQRWQYLV